MRTVHRVFCFTLIAVYSPNFDVACLYLLNHNVLISLHHSQKISETYQMHKKTKLRNSMCTIFLEKLVVSNLNMTIDTVQLEKLQLCIKRLEFKKFERFC